MPSPIVLTYVPIAASGSTTKVGYRDQEYIIPKIFSKIKIPMYLKHIHRQAGPYRRTSPRRVPPRCVSTAAYTS
jgi:hypothetical protein